MAKAKEIDFLSRVIANHLFLAQFEPLRALLLSLRKRDPELALSILRKIVFEGGRIDGVLFSDTCSSPSHLAWLSVLELLRFDTVGVNPELLRLKVEFLLLIQEVSSKSLMDDGDALNKVLDLGLKRLKSDLDATNLISEEDLKSLWRLILENAEIFEAISGNIQRQVQLLESNGTVSQETEELVKIQRNVQLAHLDALKENLKRDDMDGAVSHVRFLHQDHGVEENEYK